MRAYFSILPGVLLAISCGIVSPALPSRPWNV